MADCSVGIGSAAKMAVTVNSNAWGSGAASLGSGHRVPFISESVAAAIDLFTDPTIDGSGFRGHDLHLAENHAGAIEVKGDYRYHLTMLALAMGIAGTPSELEAGTRYEHHLELSKDLCGIYGTLGVDKVVNTAGADTSGWIYDHVKFSSLVMNLGGLEPASFSFGIIGRDASDGQDASAWTYPTNREPPNDNEDILGLDAQWRINDQTGAALGTGDVIDRPATAVITLERNLEGSALQGASGSAVVDEPVPVALPTVSVQLGFENYDSDLHAQFIDARRNQTIKKLDVVYTGDTLGAGNYTFTVRFGSLKVNNVTPNIQGEGRIPLTVEMSAAAVVTGDAIAGMTDLNSVFDVKIVNEVSDDPLS